MKYTFLCKGKKPAVTGRGTVAVIGAGPAGLAAAGALACNGYDVDVYDKLLYPGGLMTFAIPPYRVPREHVEEGVEDLKQNFGVNFRLGVKVFCNEEVRHDEGDAFVHGVVDLRDLVEDYDGVIITTGTWRSRRLWIPGEWSEGVFSALEYLFRIWTYEQKLSTVPPPNPQKVVVIGGGLSAIDATEESLRRGIKEVYLVYRRTADYAPAGKSEIERMKKLGAKFIELAQPVEVLRERGRITGVKFVRMKLGEPDSSGRPRPIPIEGSEFVIEADALIAAIGELPTPPVEKECLGIKTDKRGRILVDENYNAGHPKIYAAGDVRVGPSKIGTALSDGMKAALAFHRNFMKSK